MVLQEEKQSKVRLPACQAAACLLACFSPACRPGAGREHNAPALLSGGRAGRTMPGVTHHCPLCSAMCVQLEAARVALVHQFPTAQVSLKLLGAAMQTTCNVLCGMCLPAN